LVRAGIFGRFQRQGFWILESCAIIEMQTILTDKPIFIIGLKSRLGKRFGLSELSAPRRLFEC
jgi:hypothetical protein